MPVRRKGRSPPCVCPSFDNVSDAVCLSVEHSFTVSSIAAAYLCGIEYRQTVFRRQHYILLPHRQDLAIRSQRPILLAKEKKRESPKKKSGINFKNSGAQHQIHLRRAPNLDGSPPPPSHQITSHCTTATLLFIKKDQYQTMVSIIVVCLRMPSSMAVIDHLMCLVCSG